MWTFVCVLLFGVICFVAGFLVCKNNYSGIVKAEQIINKVKEDIK